MDAPAPFDSSAISDTVIRTSDNIHFYVLGAFLYYVSDALRDRLSLNQGRVAASEGVLPVLDFSEDSEIFNILLEHIYPSVDEPRFRDLDIFKRASRAAQAYSMSVVEEKLKKQILTSSFITAEPFRLYAIAIVLGWEELALVAARATLKVPLKELVFVDELRDISGAEFYRFLNYRFRCEGSKNASDEKFAILIRRPPPLTSKECLLGVQGPFVTSSNGNLILRSSDSVDFPIAEALIRFVSPFIDTKFPLKDDEKIDGRPVIIVPERSEVLRGLLNIIYPGGDDDHDVLDCHLFGEMVRAARKLEISTAEKQLKKQGTALACKEPLRMYAIATSFDFVEVAKIAALNTLSEPLQDMTFVEEFNQITGADLFRLMRFRFSCAEAVRNVVKDSTVHAECGFQDLRSHIYHLPSDGSVSDEVYQRLEDCPRGDTYRAIYFSDIAYRLGYSDPSSCSFSIRISAFDAMEKYRDGLVAAVEDAVSKVCST